MVGLYSAGKDTLKRVPPGEVRGGAGAFQHIDMVSVLFGASIKCCSCSRKDRLTKEPRALSSNAERLL